MLLPANLSNHLLYLFILCLLGTWSGFPSPANAQHLPWNDPGVSSLNQHPVHSSYIPFANFTEAKTQQPELSSVYRPLTGSWKYFLASSLDRIPEEATEVEFSAQGWSSTKLPKHWELHSKKEDPIFSPSSYLFDAFPPYLPDEGNTVACYRKPFRIPEDWKDKHIFLHFAGVDAGVKVWVNGELIGYGEGAALPLEFEISKFVESGNNMLAVQVFRWTDGTYLENHNSWRLKGIYREVSLIARPKTYLHNLAITTNCDLDTTFDELIIRTDLAQQQRKIARLQSQFNKLKKKKPAAAYLRYALFDAEGLNVFADSIQAVDELSPTGLSTVEKRFPIYRAERWSAERPYLYTLYVELLDSKKQVLEVIPQKVGFRSLNWESGKLSLNGQPLFLRGIDLYEFSPKTGRVQTTEQIVKDIKRLKQFNVNAIRTSQGPLDTRWYELADQYGLYIIDQANIAHGQLLASGTYLSDDPLWRQAFVSRGLGMLKRDHNHPSVIAWALGEASGKGRNIHDMMRVMQSIDNTRPLLFTEGNQQQSTAPIYADFRWSLPGEQIEEMDSSMQAKSVFKLLKGQSKGNGFGGISSKIQTLRQDSKVQGIFVEAWIPQVLTDEKGKWIIPSEGDTWSLGSFSPHRRPQAEMHELKKAFQAFEIRLLSHETGEVVIKNLAAHLPKKDLQLEWVLLADGVLLESGVNSLEANAVSDTVQLFSSFPQVPRGKEAVLHVSLRLRKPQPWAEAGHELAWEQFILNGEDPLAPLLYTSLIPSLNLEQQGDTITVFHEEFSLLFHNQAKGLARWVYKGMPLISQMPTPQVARTPTLYDRQGGEESLAQAWKDARIANLNLEQIQLSAEQLAPYLVKVSLRAYLPASTGGLDYIADYFIWGSGDVVIENHLYPRGRIPSLARVGLSFPLETTYSRLSWYGKGPFESYVDRQVGAKLGYYHASTSSLNQAYLTRSDHGTRSGVRHLSIRNSAGIGLQIYGQPDMAFQISKPSQASDKAVLSIDDLHMGLSADIQQRNKSLLYPQSYHFSFRMHPVDREAILGEGKELPRVLPPRIEIVEIQKNGQLKIQMTPATKGSAIYYQEGNTGELTRYSEPFWIKSDQEIQAYASKPGLESSTKVKAYFGIPSFTSSLEGSFYQQY